ncbi:MAG: permease [Herbinix sp.]|jgi:hypothetical protein|nr:permease [Herbinix sp.]
MPIRKSNKWIIVFILYTLVVLISLIASRVILGSDLTGGYIVRLLSIALGTSVLPCIGGYFGKRVFFIVYSLSILFGIFYMFYVVIADTAPGWGDLASLVGFMFMIGLGTVSALLAEIVISILTFYRQKK